MKRNINDKEQYGRRNSLHFNNLTVDTSQKGEDTIHGVVHFINNNMMPSGEKSMIKMLKGVIHLKEK